MKLTSQYIESLIREELKQEGVRDILGKVKGFFSKEEEEAGDAYNSALDELVSKYEELMDEQNLKPREAVQILISRDDIKKLINTIFVGTVGDYGEVLTTKDVPKVLRKIVQHKRYKK